MSFYAAIPRMALSVMLLILTLIPTLKQSVDMYRATKQWQLNKYMQLLMRDGVLYFLVYVSLFPTPQSPSIPSILLPILLLSTCTETNHLNIFSCAFRYTLSIISSAVVQNFLKISSTWQVILILLCYTTIFPIMPRFFISMRELYDRDTHACWQGVDTGFGVFSQPIACENVAVSAIAFEDRVVMGRGWGQVVEGDAHGSWPIQLEVLGDGTHQV